MKRVLKLALSLATIMVMTSSCGILCVMEEILMGCPPPPPPRHHYHHAPPRHHHHGYHHHHWCDAAEAMPEMENIA